MEIKLEILNIEYELDSGVDIKAPEFIEIPIEKLNDEDYIKETVEENLEIDYPDFLEVGISEVEWRIA